MKYTLLLVALACGMAYAVEEPVPILAQEASIHEDGSYHYNFETGDGVKASQDGTLKKIDAETSVEVAEGSFSYPGEDGKTLSVQYTADENGYQPHGDHIHQIPELIARSLKWIQEHPAPADKKL